MTLTLAAYATANGVLQQDFVLELLRNSPEDRAEAPIYSELITRGLVSPTLQVRFDWRTLGLPGRRNQVNNGGAAYDANTTSIVVDDASVFPVDHLVLCEATREVILVTARNLGNNTLTVVRGVGTATGQGGVAAAAGSVADNVWLNVIGPAKAEATQAMAFRAASLGTAWNFSQNFGETVRISNLMLGSQSEHEEARGYERRQKSWIALRNIERAILFGSRGTTTASGGGVSYSMMGLLNAITTNRFTGVGALSRATFETTHVPSIFATGTMRKLLVCGPTAFSVFQTIYRDTVQRTPSERLGGSNIEIIRTPYGELIPVLSRSLDGGFAGTAIAVDIESNVRLRHLPQPAMGNAPATSGLLQLVENTGAPDLEAVQDEWRANVGLQYGNEGDHAVMLGISGSA